MSDNKKIITPQILSDLVRERSLEGLKNDFNGIKGISNYLNIDLNTRIKNDNDIDKLRNEFGKNYIDIKPPPTYLSLLYDGLHDVTLIILLVSAGISLFLGIILQKDYEKGWIEGTSII